MKRLLLLGVTILVALATLTRSAPACGDPPAPGVAGREQSIDLSRSQSQGVVTNREIKDAIGAVQNKQK